MMHGHPSGMPGYRFPNGDVVRSPTEMFRRILDTRESAVAVEGNEGWHKGRTYTYEEVRALCDGKLTA